MMQNGHQCGMLWGASLAVEAEAYRRCHFQNQVIRDAITATRHLIESFESRENTISCREITYCEFSNKWSFAKHFCSGSFLYCFDLAEKWALEEVTTVTTSTLDPVSK